MRAGLLTNRMTLQSPSTSQATDGQVIAGWTDVAVVYGDIRYLSGLEGVRANAISSVANCSIRVRFMAVNAKQRLAHVDGRVFNILATLPDLKRREYVDLVCEEVT